MTPDPKVHNLLFGVSVRLAEELPVEWTRRHWDGTKTVRYHGEVDGYRGIFEVFYSANSVLIRVKIDRFMHYGVQTYRTHEGMVIPAYAGIQGVSRGWIPACAGMTGNLPFHLCIPVRRATVKMHNTL